MLASPMGFFICVGCVRGGSNTKYRGSEYSTAELPLFLQWGDSITNEPAHPPEFHGSNPGHDPRAI
jgi:hypothetical protein